MDGIYLPDVMERLDAAARAGNVAAVDHLTEQVRTHARFRAVADALPSNRACAECGHVLTVGQLHKLRADLDFLECKGGDHLVRLATPTT